jgi:hypothetical protein
MVGGNVASNRTEVRIQLAPPSSRVRTIAISCSVRMRSTAVAAPLHVLWAPWRHRSTSNRRPSPGTPLRGWTPRSRKDSPEPATKSLTVLDTSTSPVICLRIKRKHTPPRRPWNDRLRRQTAQHPFCTIKAWLRCLASRTRGALGGHGVVDRRREPQSAGSRRGSGSFERQLRHL